MTLVLTPSDVAYLKGKVGPAWLTRQIEMGRYSIAGETRGVSDECNNQKK